MLNYDEESGDDCFENNDNDEQFRSKFIVISNHCDHISVHTNANQLKDSKIEELKYEQEEELDTGAVKNIVDVSQITRNLTSKEIRLLTLHDLISDIEASQTNFSFIEKLNKTNTFNEMIWVDDNDNSYGLENRSKFEKLSKEQTLFIKEVLIQADLSHKQIQSKYNISYSVLNRIKRCSWSEIKNSKWRDLIKINNSEWQMLMEVIKDYILKTRTTVTAKEITNHINLIQQKSYSVKYIRNFMKSQAKLTFKRVKSRPWNIDIEKISWIRGLFAVKFSKQIKKETLLINIDESSINRSTKEKYSWGFKGTPIEAKNVWFRGSVSMVMAICSNGSWINFVINETINSENFMWFLKIMNSWLESNNLFGYSRALIILDNWSIHKSSNTKSLFKKMKHLVFYIPPYTPDFSPVEMSFSLIKRSLYRICKSKPDMLTLKENYAKIFDALVTVKSDSVRRMFGVYYKNIKQYLWT